MSWRLTDRAEYREGTEAAQKFDDTMHRILSVPKAELTKREAAYQKSRRSKKTGRSRTR